MDWRKVEEGKNDYSANLDGGESHENHVPRLGASDYGSSGNVRYLTRLFSFVSRF